MNRLTFFFKILTLLTFVTLCFSQVATAQSEEQALISLPSGPDIGFLPNTFIVYGRATNTEAGITENVQYNQITESMPDLEVFFTFGGTLELLTTDANLRRHDIVISEIMWGTDTGNNIEKTNTQWIELYSPHINTRLTPKLYLLFTPFQSHPHREDITTSDVSIDITPPEASLRVLDAISNLHLGKWNLPGRSGRRPYVNVVSAYRHITYPEGENGTQHEISIPPGSYKASWKATPELGQRNTNISLPYIATPGTRHVSDMFFRAPLRTSVRSDQIVINEVRNDTSRYNHDWVELKNITRLPVNIENWELSIVTDVDEDTDLVNLPDYEMLPGEILLLQARPPQFTTLAGGIDIQDMETPETNGATHKYFVDTNFNLPNTGKFLLLLRKEPDKNGKDEAIADYAGNGFFTDTSYDYNTDFWPRKGQPLPTDVADFGDNPTFGSLDTTWARLRYQSNDGHHTDAWTEVGAQGCIGYDPDADLHLSPGTPGYENTALKTRIEDKDIRTPLAENEYTAGVLSISEIMVDPGPQQNQAQWIEIYNSSLTEGVNLEGWKLEIRNFEDDGFTYVSGHLIFNEAIIPPNQTLLLVIKNAANNLSSNRIYNLYNQHRHQLKATNRRVLLLNPEGFHLKLTDVGDPQLDNDDIVVDEVGNLSVDDRNPTRLWNLPESDPEVRRPLVRQYGTPFRRNLQDGIPDAPTLGTLSAAWRQADKKYTSPTYYGDTNDRGTPGYRLGSPLPVELSSFRPNRNTASGTVVITWTTEAELDNAGFNILRSESKNGEFKIINPALIHGAGTSSEKHTYSFTDTTADPNLAYYYQIEDVSFNGIRRTLATVRLKGHISGVGKLTRTWANVKASTP